MTSKLKIAATLLCLLPFLSHGVNDGSVILQGKASSKVTAFVLKRDNFIVTDENNGWFEQGLTLTNMGEQITQYSVTAPIRVTSTSGVFQVSLAEPIILQNQAKPELQFRDMKASMGLLDEQDPKELTYGANIRFENPASAVPGEDSIGHYLINISGYEPEGGFKAVTGTYTGVISLLFEPLVK